MAERSEVRHENGEVELSFGGGHVYSAGELGAS